MTAYSQTFKSTPAAFEISPVVREVFEALPVVIFAKAIREAFFSAKKPAPALARAIKR